MAENEIITQQDPQMQMFAQLMEGILKKLERYCATARPMLGGEVYLTGEEVCKLLRLSPRTLQDYRDNGTIAYCKIGGKYFTSKAIYKLCSKGTITQYPRSKADKTKCIARNENLSQGYKQE